MVPLGDEAQVEAHCGPFGDSANVVQDRCTVCVERIIGSKIILDAFDGTRRLRGSSGSSFRSIWS